MNKTKLFILLGSGVLVAALAVVVTLLLSSPPSEPTAPWPAGGDCIAYPYGDDDDNESNEISVSGTGMINVNPDVAYISLGVTTRGIDPKTVIDENNRAIADVINAVKDKNVAEKDIRTTDFNMYLDYHYGYDEDGKEILGHTVSNNVSIVVRDIAAVGDILGAAADAGANVSGGVQFGLLDSSAAYNEALVLAIENAVGKAEAIAGALGKSVTSPSSVVETVTYYSPYYALAENASKDASVGSVPVQTGKLTVTANVQMVYEYAE